MDSRTTEEMEDGMQFHRSFSGAPWESRVGYCRSLRAGNRVWITGTAPVAEDGGVTMVEVSRLIDPDMLIEIEADAIVTD